MSVIPVLEGTEVEARYLESRERIKAPCDGFLCTAGDITFLIPKDVVEEQIKKLRQRIRERAKKEEE